VRGSYGIFNGRQNMLSQVGSSPPTVCSSDDLQKSAFGGGTKLGWPNAFAATPSNPPVRYLRGGAEPVPCFSGVRVFSKDYANPRIYNNECGVRTRNLPRAGQGTWIHDVKRRALDLVLQCQCQRLFDAKGIRSSLRGQFGPQLGDVFVTASTAKSLYRGVTIDEKAV